MSSLVLMSLLASVLSGPTQFPRAQREGSVTVRPFRTTPQPPESKVTVTVVAILASDRCKCIDPLLKDVAAELQKIDPRLTGFSVAAMNQKSLAAHEKARFSCLDDACVEVVIQQCVDKNGHVCLAVKAPLQNEVVYQTVCGKFFLIATRCLAQEQVPPASVVRALCQALSRNPAGGLQSVDTLLQSRTRARLIVGIRVQPCLAK
jgi:hypothetical protein